jgi:activator of 2-hydroxyglutaryl-CoA dehydratase
MDQVNPTNLIVGLDVGSTTVKSVVVDTSTDQIIWSDYQRHDTKQPEKCLEFLKRMEAEAGIKAGETRIFVTSTGPWQESISLMASSEPIEKTKPKMSSKSF